jgi:hypothetical protein
VGDGHGYVSLLDILAHLRRFRAFSIKDFSEVCDGVHNVMKHSGMVCGDEEVLLLICCELSDVFECALSTTASLKSYWVKTVTIMPCYS